MFPKGGPVEFSDERDDTFSQPDVIYKILFIIVFQIPFSVADIHNTAHSFV